MARLVTTAMKQAALAQQTGEAIVTLLKFWSDEEDGGGPIMPSPVRVVNDFVEVSRTEPVDGAVVYSPFPFSIDFPSELPERMGTIMITVDNIERQLVPTLKALKEPLRVTIHTILVSDPTNTAVEWGTYLCRSGDYDKNVITFQCEQENLIPISYPGELFNPHDWNAIG